MHEGTTQFWEILSVKNDSLSLNSIEFLFFGKRKGERECVRICVCLFLSVHVYVFVCFCVCLYVPVCVSVRVYVCVFVYTCAYGHSVFCCTPASLWGQVYSGYLVNECCMGHEQGDQPLISIRQPHRELGWAERNSETAVEDTKHTKSTSDHMPPPPWSLERNPEIQHRCCKYRAGL